MDAGSYKSRVDFFLELLVDSRGVFQVLDGFAPVVCVRGALSIDHGRELRSEFAAAVGELHDGELIEDRALMFGHDRLQGERQLYLRALVFVVLLHCQRAVNLTTPGELCFVVPPGQVVPGGRFHGCRIELRRRSGS